MSQRMNDVCRKHGVTHDQYNILRILRGVHPTGHPRCEITKRLISRAPDVTRLLDRLVRQGLVERGWVHAHHVLSAGMTRADRFTVASASTLAAKIASKVSFTVTLNDAYDSKARSRGARKNNDGQLLFGVKTDF